MGRRAKPPLIPKCTSHLYPIPVPHTHQSAVSQGPPNTPQSDFCAFIWLGLPQVRSLQPLQSLMWEGVTVSHHHIFIIISMIR